MRKSKSINRKSVDASEREFALVKGSSEFALKVVNILAEEYEQKGLADAAIIARQFARHIARRVGQ